MTNSKELYENKPNALLAFLVPLKDTLDKRGVSVKETVRVIAYMLRDNAEKVYETYTSEGLKADAYVYHGSWPMVISALIQRFITVNVLQEAHYQLILASQRPNEETCSLIPEFQDLEDNVVTFLQLWKKLLTMVVT